MKKILAISIIALVYVGSNIANALLSPSELLNRALKDMPIKKVINQNENKCASFAGSWSGICENEPGEKKLQSFVIEQSECVGITFNHPDGSKFNIGLDGFSFDNKAIGGSKGFSQFTSIAKWSPDRQSIEVIMVGLANYVQMDRPRSLLATSSIFKDGADLVTIQQSTGIGGDYNQTCHYKLVK